MALDRTRFNYVKGDQTRARILEMAKAMFTARGYSGVRMGELAVKLGITEQTVHNHVGTKQNLYAMVFDPMRSGSSS